jgi:hypothetical protein
MPSTNPVRAVKCSRCGHALSLDDSGPCPRCGETRKTYDVPFEATLHLQGSLQLTHIREYYENHPLAFAVVVALTVASSLVGLVLTGWIGVAVGLLIGAIGFFVVPRVKVREIRSGL